MAILLFPQTRTRRGPQCLFAVRPTVLRRVGCNHLFHDKVRGPAVPEHFITKDDSLRGIITRFSDMRSVVY
eukprot:1192659-Prorocentrum_minimum.AAC.2